MAYAIPEKDIRERAKTDGITHLSTGIAVLHEGKILAVRRTASDFLGGNYELPGGGVDAGETLEESVGRELLEETGLRLEEIVATFPGFEYTTPTKPKVRQFNFLVKTSNHDVALSPEHDAFSWFDETTVDKLDATGPMSDCFKQALAVDSQLELA